MIIIEKNKQDHLENGSNQQSLALRSQSTRVLCVLRGRGEKHASRIKNRNKNYHNDT